MSGIKLGLKDIFDLDSAVLYNPDEFKPVSNVVIDSRSVKKNSLFVAIKGKRFDGHKFIGDAIKNGASAIVINENKFSSFKDLDIPVIIVKDTVKALGELAKTWRRKLKAKVIGITGSSGKTSTKDILATILSEKYQVQKTILNNNNHIGVPLTILSTNQKHDVLVAEVGTNHFGEIPYSADILQPELALITNIGDSHLKFLKDRKGVLKEKSSLFDTTLNKNGKIFLNYDDPLLKNFKDNKKQKVTFGFDKKADVSGKIIKYDELGKPVIEISSKRKKMEFNFPVYGELSAKNFLASSAVALSLGLNENQINNSLKKIKSSPHRLESIQFKNFLLLDDTYNANPDSMKAAIEILSKVTKYERKILILGDMLELGAHSEKYHSSLSKNIYANGITEVYTIGKLMRNLNGSLKRKNLVKKHFANRSSLKNFLNKIDPSNSVILVKGSRGMKMEEFVETIKQRSEK
jgi:UDP-N-acetylmuramoyl-tripeptide--D-alanyl-D-alanine ligase